MSSYKFNRKCFKNYLGGYDGGQPSGVGDSDNSDEILEYDPLTGRWNLVDRMIQARSNHAVAVINFEPELCVEPSTAEPPTNDCKAGWSVFNGKCYKYFNEKKTWDDAEVRCLEEKVR